MTESVLFTSRQINFITLLTLSQMHIRVQTVHLALFEPTESLVLLNVSECVFLVGSYRDNLTLMFNAVDHVAKSLLFSNTDGWKSCNIERTISQTNLVRETLLVDNLALAFSSKHGLNLLENGCELGFCRLEQTELPGGGLTPVHGSLRESLVAHCVLANSDEVVTFNS